MPDQMESPRSDRTEADGFRIFHIMCVEKSFHQQEAENRKGSSSNDAQPHIQVIETAKQLISFHRYHVHIEIWFHNPHSDMINKHGNNRNRLKCISRNST